MNNLIETLIGIALNLSVTLGEKYYVVLFLSMSMVYFCVMQK
jgi:hypothetical protein